MNPIIAAKEVYENEPCGHSFYDALKYSLEFGYVHSTPSYFVLAWPTNTNYERDRIINPMKHKATELTLSPNMWHIGLVAGDTREAFKLIPHSLDYISFERENKFKLYDYDRFRSIILR